MVGLIGWLAIAGVLLGWLSNQMLVNLGSERCNCSWAGVISPRPPLSQARDDEKLHLFVLVHEYEAEHAGASNVIQCNTGCVRPDLTEA